MRIWHWSVLGCIGLFALIFLWASYPWDLFPKTEKGQVGSLPNSPEEDDRPTTLTLLTWNISYAYGVGSDGTAYQAGQRERLKQNLEHMAQTIRASNADVVFLQEVDFDSSRSFDHNQLLELAGMTGLRHWARASTWRANYVPFPFWPPSEHFGAVDSGGGVLSRWPIKSCEVDLLVKPLERPWWYNLFYLHRYFQTVEIKVGERTLKVLNLHFESWDKGAKLAQARALVEKVKAERPDFIAGDFNMIPDGAIKRSGFINPKDSYENDLAMRTVRQIPYRELVEDATYNLKEDAWFTFPSDRPDRRLDYIFFRPDWVLMRKEVVTGLHSEASDHLPLKAIFKFFGPEFIRD